MQVPYGEGVATHIGPEPCADVRKGAGEASVGERTGQPLNRERPIIPGAAAAHPRNGKRKLAKPTATASFHLSLNICGSSSAPARNVSTIAPMPARNFTQDSSVPRTAEPMTAPMMSWATVPTTISESAVEMRSQIESKLAISARANHSAEMPKLRSWFLPWPPRRRATWTQAQKQKTRLAAGRRRTPTARLSR